MLVSEADQVAQAFYDIVSRLTYYNDLARREEIALYSAQKLAEKIVEDPYSVLVAFSGSNIAGFCFNYIDDYTIWLEWIIVLPRMQHQGVGSALLDQLTMYSRDRRCHKIWCDCRTANNVSQKFLERNGFEIIATILDHWYRQDFILLQKFIA